MEVRNAWGEVAMRDRNIRVGMVALVLAVPWLLGMANPVSPSSEASAYPVGIYFLMDVVLIVGFLWAGHERRVLSSWARRPRRRAVVVTRATGGVGAGL